MPSRASTVASSAAPASSSATTSCPTRRWSPRCGRCSAPVTRCSPSSPTSTRAELARLIPELGEPPGEPETERGEIQRRLFDAILELIAAPRRRAAGAAVDRGHPLGRPLDALLPALPRRQPQRGAGARGRDLPLRRAPPPPPAATAARRARAHARARRIELAALRPRRARRPARRHPRRGPGRRRGRAHVRAQRGQPAVHRGAARRRASTAAAPLPPSLREALLLRVERLPDETQRAAAPARGRRPRRTTRCSRRPPGSRRSSSRARSARRSRRRSWSWTRPSATASATPCCAR